MYMLRPPERNCVSPDAPLGHTTILRKEGEAYYNQFAGFHSSGCVEWVFVGQGEIPVCSC